MRNRRVLKNVADNIIRFHWPIIIVSMLSIGFFSYYASEIDYVDNMEKFLPEGNPETILYQKINQEFGGLNIALIGLEFEDVFTHDNLKKIESSQSEYLIEFHA